MRNHLRFSGVFLFLVLLAIFMSACGGGSSSGSGVPSVPSTFTPTAGTWAGTNIQFNVSADSSSLTSTGSSITGSGSFYLGPVSYSGACSGSTHFYSTQTYLITNKSFTVTVSAWDLTITGQFTGPNSANGTYSFSVSLCGGTVSGSGSWTATPAS